jgi:hypothetical protein
MGSFSVHFGGFIPLAGSRGGLLFLETLCPIFPKFFSLLLHIAGPFAILKLLSFVLLSDLFHFLLPRPIQILIVSYLLQLHAFPFSYVVFHLLLEACFNTADHLFLCFVLLLEVVLYFEPAAEFVFHPHHLI